MTAAVKMLMHVRDLPSLDSPAWIAQQLRRQVYQELPKMTGVLGHTCCFKLVSTSAAAFLWCAADH